MNIHGHPITIGRLKSHVVTRLRQLLLFLSAPLFHLAYLALSFAADRRPMSMRMLTREDRNGGYDLKIEVDLVICVVAGPEPLRGILDLLDSAKRYIDGSYRFIIVDDSCTLRIWRAIRKKEVVDYIRNWKHSGIKGLYGSLQKAYLYALRNYRFAALLKVDTDTIITGEGLVHDIKSHFVSHAGTGMLGSYRLTCLGIPRDFSPIASQFERDYDLWKYIIEKAEKNGYRLGEHAQGGAYVISYSCLHDMLRSRYLTLGQKGSYVAEDGIFSLFVRALGYTIDEFAYNGPFAIAWTGLPLSTEEIVKQSKKVVHSVKFTAEELQVREYFSRLRQ